MRHTFLLSFLTGSLLVTTGIATALPGSDSQMEQDRLRREMEAEGESPENFMSGESGFDSVNELQSLLNMPISVQIKEYQEDLENPPNIFDNQDTVNRIFGDTPPFIYFPEGVDPMIIPWVRSRIIAEELMQEAMVASSSKDYDKALDILRSIREEYPETSAASNVGEEMAKVQALKEKLLLDDTPDKIPVRLIDSPPGNDEVALPDWVRDNTTGIVIDKTPVVVVGNDFLEIGEPIPRYPGVGVKSISASEVIFEYQNKEFSVPVDGAF